MTADRLDFLGNGRGALRLPEFLQCPVQVLRRIQFVLKQKLDGAFTRLASFAHKSKSTGKSPKAKAQSRTMRCVSEHIHTCLLYTSRCV